MKFATAARRYVCYCMHELSYCGHDQRMHERLWNKCVIDMRSKSVLPLWNSSGSAHLSLATNIHQYKHSYYITIQEKAAGLMLLICYWSQRHLSGNAMAGFYNELAQVIIREGPIRFREDGGGGGGSGLGKCDKHGCLCKCQVTQAYFRFVRFFFSSVCLLRVSLEIFKVWLKQTSHS